MGNQRAGSSPDNNKRLAALEAGVSTLAITLAANGVDVPEGADPFELAIGRVKRAAELEAAAEQTTPGEIAAIARAEGAEKRVAELEAELAARPVSAEEAHDGAIARLEEQIDELERQGAAKDSRITELEAGAPVIVQQPDGGEPEETPAETPLERPEGAADVGPQYAVVYSSAELVALLAAGDVPGFELAFSNGQFEVVALNRIAIAPSDLLAAEGRVVVVPPVFAKLAAVDAAEELHGVGLLLDGEQVAYCAFLDQLKLEPGTERRFDRAIFF
jgi:hypothetical protein